MKEHSYKISVVGTTEKTIALEILDNRWTIQDVILLCELPSFAWTTDEDELEGEISCGGQVIARYEVLESERKEELDRVWSANGQRVSRFRLGIR